MPKFKNSNETFSVIFNQCDQYFLGPFPCALGLYDVKYEGPLDNNELPKGNGRLTRMVQKVAQNQRKNCFELLPTIESMHGRFVKGYPQGKATIR